jgi:hypothetical protein
VEAVAAGTGRKRNKAKEEEWRKKREIKRQQDIYIIW